MPAEPLEAAPEALARPGSTVGRLILGPVTFEGALGELGFRLERRARGVDHYARRPNRFLTYWVQVHDKGTALFTWEFAIGEYAATLGLQVGSDEHLNTFLFPREDARGPQEAAWLSGQIETTELLLRSVSLLDAEDGAS